MISIPVYGYIWTSAKFVPTDTPNALQWPHKMVYNATPNALQCHTKCFTMTTSSALQWPYQMLYNARTKYFTMTIIPNALQCHTRCFTMPHQMLYNATPNAFQCHTKCITINIISKHSLEWPHQSTHVLCDGYTCIIPRGWSPIFKTKLLAHPGGELIVVAGSKRCGGGWLRGTFVSWLHCKAFGVVIVKHLVWSFLFSGEAIVTHLVRSLQSIWCGHCIACWFFFIWWG